MIHSSLQPLLGRKIVLDGNALYGRVGTPPRILIEGGLRYRDEQGNEQSAWVDGYWGLGGTPTKPAKWNVRWQTFDRVKLGAFARSITEPALGLNVEHYGVDGFGRLVDIIEFIRAERHRAGLRPVAIGAWSLLPTSEHATVLNHAQLVDWRRARPHFEHPGGDAWWRAVTAEREDAFGAWQAANDLTAAKLVPHINFTLPSCYIAQEISAAGPAWGLAREPEIMIEESRRVAPHLPCLACFNPYIEKTRKQASTALTGAFLAACTNADSIVAWCDENTPKSTYAALLKRAVKLLADQDQTILQ